jgi:hypothetical protein
MTGGRRAAAFPRLGPALTESFAGEGRARRAAREAGIYSVVVEAVYEISSGQRTLASELLQSEHRQTVKKGR